MGDRLDNALRDIRQASRRLQPEQGDRARRNAREAMLLGLRAARNALDLEFPLTRKPRQVMTPEARKRRGHKFRAEHREISAARAAELQARKIPVVQRTLKSRAVGRVEGPWWVSLWIWQMLEAKSPLSQIADCVHDWRKRKRVLALLQLGATRAEKSK